MHLIVRIVYVKFSITTLMLVLLCYVSQMLLMGDRMLLELVFIHGHCSTFNNSICFMSSDVFSFVVGISNSRVVRL